MLSSSGAKAGQPYRYSTKWFHPASGLYDYGYRFYSPGMGRWINRDPIREYGGLNLYGFEGNDPVNLCNFSGLSARSRHAMGTIGGLAGAVVGGTVAGPMGAVAGAFLGAALLEGFEGSQDGCGFWNGFNSGIQNEGGDIAVVEAGAGFAGVAAAAGAARLALRLIEEFGFTARSAGIVEEVSLAGRIKGQFNCVTCSLTFDARLGGQRISSFPGVDSENANVMQFRKYFGKRFRLLSIDEIVAIMEESGPGSRGLIAGYGKTEGVLNHMMNVITNKAGQVKFWDYQQGRAADLSKYLDKFDFLMTN